MPTKKQMKKLKFLIRQRSISIMRGKKEFDTLHSLTQEQANELIYFLEYEWNLLSGYQFCSRVKELQEFFQFGIPVDRWRKECQRNSGVC